MLPLFRADSELHWVKADVPQDPCIGEPKKLRIRYLFRDQVHQVTIDDEQTVRAPIKCKLGDLQSL